MAIPKILEKIRNSGGGVFKAVYNTTTYTKIKEAYEKGQDIIVEYSSHIYDLVTIPTGSNSLIFIRRNNQNETYANNIVYYITVSSASTWTNSALNKGLANTALYFSSQTNLSSSIGYYRPIRTSTSAPTASDGKIGDIWIQYSE